MLTCEDLWFKDQQGRTVMLRGVNLGGSSKVPAAPDGATHKRAEFFNHRHVSFVGRPFLLEEADAHFARLRHWGFNLLRLLVTWEAIEHEGPGLYDKAYLAYLRALVEKAAEFDFLVLIDPHQDVWSRFSGGDGAPGWTFDLVGMDIRRFAGTGAAVVHAVHGDPFPRMIWPTNGSKLAAATMFTLFFGGNDFASETTVKGEPVQEVLQRHYIAAFQQVARSLAGQDNMIGYGVMNEPGSGYIGWQDLTKPGGTLMLGDMPSPFQAMLLGAGIPQEVAVYGRRLVTLTRTGSRLLNRDGVSVWKEGVESIWRQHSVWDMDSRGKPRLQRPDYFSLVEGRKVHFARDYLRPFVDRFAEAIRKVDQQAIIFVEGEAGHPPPRWQPHEMGDYVYAPHWYDGFTLFMGRFFSWFGADMRTGKVLIGPGRVRRSYARQLAQLKEEARTYVGGAPTLLAEFGVPFDLNNKSAYRTGDFRAIDKALDRSLKAVESNLLSSAIWNYTADNSNERGDQWNCEDFSIFSRDQQANPDEIDSGGRGLAALLRPYPMRTAGEPQTLAFNMVERTFTFSFKRDPRVPGPTVLYVPRYQYPNGCSVAAGGGTIELDLTGQRLLYWPEAETEVHTIEIAPA